MSATVEFPVSWSEKTASKGLQGVRMDLLRTSNVKSGLMLDHRIIQSSTVDRICVSRENLLDVLHPKTKMSSTASYDSLQKVGQSSSALVSLFDGGASARGTSLVCQAKLQQQFPTVLSAQQRCRPFTEETSELLQEGVSTFEVQPPCKNSKIHSYSSDQLVEFGKDGQPPTSLSSQTTTITVSLSERCRQFAVALAKRVDTCCGSTNQTTPPVGSRCATVAEVLLHLGSDDAQAITGNFLSEQLKNCPSTILLIDCRTFLSYNANHIIGALNVTCSDSINRKRLLCGRTAVGDLVSGCAEAKERYQAAVADGSSVQLVLYDDSSNDYKSLPATQPLKLILTCIRKLGKDASFLHG